MTVKKKILNLFDTYAELSVNELVNKIGASKQMVHIAVKQLVDEGVLVKLGAVPKTIYRKKAVEKSNINERESTNNISEAELTFLQDNFLIVTDIGNLVEGIDAFTYWCKQRNLPLEKTIKEFILTKKKYETYYNKAHIIDGIEKLKNTKEYETIWLDNLYYLDFYAIERFGKTRLGTLLHYAKQGQNKFLMNIMMQEIDAKLKLFIEENNNLSAEWRIDAVAFVPPTIRREVQIMKFMQQKLNLNLPHIEIKKISGIIPIPQKSLSKMNERIRNAENTFAVADNRQFKHVLLIDDAVGSGSTLNQIAEKIKNKQVAKKVTGIAVVGSFKGFDVITDV
jgi:DNA-binding Lrp family transcriptional regulator